MSAYVIAEVEVSDPAAYDDYRKWYRSEEYAPLIKLRQRAARGKLIIVEGA